ncbi:glycoside hydrolase family 65 protein [Vagococcus vulneris]|uniref:Family 65 glycosyl hydrolase n=1 Tax=Vagococcus vulneris TaxID=1977869 RepID=A0A430A271_9ENTE|nr:glycosyl hydrolase family 65 protein [Vagococcus vulneris]RSU00559.1 hypothetical protein CBF37_00660 [Vagococcus vulneris]
MTTEENEFMLTYHSYSKGKEEYSQESLTTVGNGFLGVRGTLPEMEISENNYPGTYLAGIYNTEESDVAGHAIFNEDFINLPNAYKIYVVVDGERINIEDNAVKELDRSLNLKNGVFQSTVVIELANKHNLTIMSERFVSMADKHYSGVKYSFSIDADDVVLNLISSIDGDVYNYNVERYRSLTNRHLDILDLGAHKNHAWLRSETKNSKINILQETLLTGDLLSSNDINIVKDNKEIKQEITFKTEKNKMYSVEKLVYTDYSKTVIPEKKIKPLDYIDVKQQSINEWEKLWKAAEIVVEGDEKSQFLINLHTYHLLCSASPTGNKELDASVTARGLHGEAYRGHIFWDELFILPFYINHFPKTARELLMYRYTRLNQAKINAKEAGHKGAMYPWQSGLTGDEQSQKMHLNPVSGEWKEDHSQNQRHVSLAIAFNIIRYYDQTKDANFMINYGLEMLMEISLFWLHLAKWDADEHRFSISGVMGPDEFHEAYPGSDKGGFKDNAYTNLMLVAVLDKLKIYQSEFKDYLTPLETKVGWTADETNKQQQLEESMYLDINNDGIIAQFDGYFKLKELDFAAYKEKHSNIYRMDRILDAEGKKADDYQVAKQADALMIFYNLPEKKVKNIFGQLGYDYTDRTLSDNLEYYLKRTTHGSTLSRVVHAKLAKIVGNDELAWQLYSEALSSDYADIQGGTTSEGIHTGVMAATLDITLSMYAGLEVTDESISLNPNLPKNWGKLSFKVSHQNILFDVVVTTKDIEIISSENSQAVIFGKSYQLRKHDLFKVSLLSKS